MPFFPQLICYSLHLGVIQGHAIQRIDVSGRDLTNYLKRLILLEHGTHHFTTTAQHEIVRDMKEKLCHVALDFELQELATASYQVSYKLPSGEIIQVGSKLLYRCAEALFKPHYDPIFFDPPSQDCCGIHKSTFNADCCGIHKATFNAIMNCDSTMHKELFKRIVLSGGTTMLPGFADRLLKEMTLLAPWWMRVKVIAPPKGTNSTWFGGAILGSLSSFEKMFMTREEYDEHGPGFSNKKSSANTFL